MNNQRKILQETINYTILRGPEGRSFKQDVTIFYKHPMSLGALISRKKLIQTSYEANIVKYRIHV